MGFLVIPAVDIKDGKAVRLSQGRIENETIYSQDPVETALMWKEMGAERLHVVDLDAAVRGKSSNKDLIKEIIRVVNIPVEVGGGIRDMKTAEEYISCGAAFLIVGTAVLESPEFYRELKESFPGKIILSLDAKDGIVSVRGWTRDLNIPLLEVVREYDDGTLAAVIYTNILRDGMKTGPDLTTTKEILSLAKVPVILAGGIKDIDHIRQAMELSGMGLLGVITGRAIYDGTLDLREAIMMVKRSAKC